MLPSFKAAVEDAEGAKQKRKAGIEPEGFYRWQKRQKADVDGLRQRFAEVKNVSRLPRGLTCRDRVQAERAGLTVGGGLYRRC